MAEDNQKTTSKKTTQASAKHYWGRNAHLANGTSSSKSSSSKSSSNKSSSSKKSSSTGKSIAIGAIAGLATASATKSVKKSVKKTNSKTLISVVVCFILALVLGVGVCFVMGRNDEFTLLGDDVVVIQVGQTYKDDGVKIIEYGIDMSGKAVVSTNLKVNEQGEYYADESMLANPPDKFYICYTVKSIKFGFVYGVQKIRFITFSDMSEGGE